MKKRTFLAGMASGFALQPARAFEVPPDTRPTIHGEVYSGPKVTQLFLHKGARKLYLLSGEDILDAFRVQLGFNPEGHKRQSGDGRTPEGLYYVDRRNYNSRYFLSLGISYPNSVDVARARAAGVTPGGDIFIHGEPRTAAERRKSDWTAGCIALRDEDMMQVFWKTRLGVPILIRA